MRLTGQTRGISLALVRSPKSRKRNLPKVTRIPAERGFSVVSSSHLGSVAHQGLGAGVTPGTAAMCSPSAVITMASSPGILIVSPGRTMRRGLPSFAFDGLEVGSVVVAGDIGIFSILSVVKELADLDVLHQFWHTADMVDMKVSNEQIGRASCRG